jgi:hypothetical protein
MVKRKQWPKPGLQKTIFQARYKPALKFYELLFPAVQKFDAYPHWETNRLYVVLHDYEKRCSLTIRHTDFAYEQDYGEVDNQRDNIKEALEELPVSLDITSYTRIGFRRQYLIPVRMTFEELTAILSVKFMSQDEHLVNILSASVDDLTYVVVTSEDGVKSRIRIGPAKKEEIPKLVEINQKYHLDPENRERSYVEIVEKYPNIAIFVDIDVYRQDEEISTAEAPPFLDKARDKSEQMVLALQDYILNK